MEKLFERIRKIFKKKPENMLHIDRAVLFPFISGRPEFSGILPEDLKPVYLNCYRSSGLVYNQEWNDWNTLAAINKISDGLPRYVYVGGLVCMSDGAQLSFQYRGLQMYIGNVSVENAINAGIVLFDRTTNTAVANYLTWQFIGYRIDRGA